MKMLSLFFAFSLVFAANASAEKHSQKRTYKSDSECSRFEYGHPDKDGCRPLYMDGKNKIGVQCEDGSGQGGIGMLLISSQCEHPTDKFRHRVKGHKNYKK